jgi:hypothetical protein
MPMWRRSIHDRFGYFDEDYLTSSDADLWLKAAKGGSQMKKIDDTVGIYYYNPTGRSSNPETLKQMVYEVNEMRRKYEPNYKSPQELRATLAPVNFSTISKT